MKIVIIGDGKVGHKLTIQLSEENYDVVLIDQNEGKLKEALNQLDILCITGDGADAKVQKEAGVPGADLVVACARTEYAELPARKETGGKAHDRPCKESDLLSADRSFERGLKTEYGCQPGTCGCI